MSSNDVSLPDALYSHGLQTDRTKRNVSSPLVPTDVAKRFESRLLSEFNKNYLCFKKRTCVLGDFARLIPVTVPC